MAEDRRGVLYPGRLPEFHRIAPPPELARAVRWFWIPEWDLPPGTTSRQEVLAFPACNLVVEPDGVTLVGPPTRRSERVLRGSGWAVGALLLPAAVPSLAPEPARLRDAVAPLDEPALLARVAAAMRHPTAAGAERRAGAVAAVGAWLGARVPEPDADGQLANELAAALADPAVTRVDQLAPRLHASTRTLQRTATRCFGLSLHAMIRRRRLQEGAERLREQPELGIAALAAELGYADHAHFSTDFAALLGVTPSEYRANATR
ncbi:helix-turn-helix domain-containing protein [Leucobacter luti]|uniref:AraC family transcriptional regulator n=1 Tax=Leucobacter luti TaxID=340320 RepID=A0A4Q7U052_9MICO|nr:helix-turn-helix domain-containing protein [Leucobacter luti]MBL3699101.1 AraC family transcriptional regulator [Leucobacter luti]RZT66603.1 AraC family transcriptional regulator [Leucobacter luti]